MTLGQLRDRLDSLQWTYGCDMDHLPVTLMVPCALSGQVPVEVTDIKMNDDITAIVVKTGGQP